MLLFDYVFNLGCDFFKDRIIDKSAKNKLHEALEGYFSKKKIENYDCSLDEEIDFSGLVNFVSQELHGKLEKRLFGMTKEERDQAHQDIVNQATVYSHAQSDEAQKKVKKIICDILDILHGFYWSRVPQSTQLATATVIDEVEKQNQKQTKEIIAALESFFVQTPSQNKRKLSSIQGDAIPSYTDVNYILRYIVHIDHSDCNDNIDGLPLPFDRLKQEKCIILLADAGHGKTFTLYQIYHEAEKQGYHPFFYRLRSLQEENALTMLAQEKINVDVNAVLILDGYDEMSETKRIRLQQTIDGIIAHYPEIPIIMSSRTNTYSGQTDKRKLFTIKPITKQDIDAFIRQFGIDVILWNQQASERGLEQFCANPFYLMELVNIWQAEKALPDRSDLMREIVDSRIKEDIARIQDQYIRLQQKLGETRKAFERVALVMQCIQRYSLTQDEINRLYDWGFQEIMSFHGLWVMTEDGSWSFSHNNFREYFAAIALSHMNLEQIKQFITGDSKCEYIRPSWNNVLSYLVTAYKKRDLQDWIYETQPTLITLFEKDRLNNEILTNAIKRIFSLHKERETWVDPNYSTLRKVASFCSTPEAVQYVIDELQMEQTTRHKQNLLRCLAEFNSFYHLEETVKKIVSNIAFNSPEVVQVRDDAFDVMRNHPAIFMEYIDKAASICMEETDELIIYAILSFIQRTGKAEQYIDVVIDAFDRYDHRKSKFISYKMIIERIFREVQGFDAANKVLTYLVDHKKRLHEESELFILCCNVGMKYYDNENNCFLQTLLRLFDEYDALLSLDIYSSLANYIANTHTESIFVNHIIMHQPIHHCGFILSLLISDPMIDIIIKMIADKAIDSQIVKGLIAYLPYGDSKQAKLVQGIFIHTGEMIHIDPPKDYAGERDAAHQKYFNALFDKTLFDDLVNELLMVLGNEGQICKKSIHTLFENNEYQSNGALFACYFALQAYIPISRKILIRDYKNHIKDWNTFCFDRAADSLERHHIHVNAQQKDFLVRFCIQYLSNTEFDSVIKIKENGISAPPLLISAAHIFKKLEVHVSEDLALKLLLIPSEFFDKDYYDQLPECVITQISPENLRKHIVELVLSDRWNRYTADKYIRYCLENHIIECKEKVIQYALNRALNGGFPYWALEYLEKEFGLCVILSDVLPACDDDDLLSNLARRIPGNIPSTILDTKLWNAYRNHHDMRRLTDLLKRNNKDALLEYYVQAQELMTLPDMVSEPVVPETTDAIREIESADCLPVLIDLLKLSYDSNFKDREHFGLRDSCCNAIVAIGKVDYDITHDALSVARTDKNTTVDNAILDLIDAIERDLPYDLDKPMSFDYAVLLVP